MEKRYEVIVLGSNVTVKDLELGDTYRGKLDKNGRLVCRSARDLAIISKAIRLK